jgi:hypothetical protein
VGHHFDSQGYGGQAETHEERTIKVRFEQAHGDFFQVFQVL